MEEQNPVAKEKYVLTKEFRTQEKLKLFLMAVVPNSVNQNGGIFQMRYVGVLGYTHELAIEKAKESFIKDGLGAINSYGDFIPVEDILKNINYEGVVINHIVPESEKPKLMPLETFKASLLLAGNEYLKDEKSKLALKKIIAKL